MKQKPKMKEKTISSIAMKKAENGCLVIKLAVAPLPVPLRSGRVIAEAISVLCEKAERECLLGKLERFFKRAYKAEEEKDYFRAARAFTLAIYCEAKLQPDVDNTCGYVREALPVY